MRPTVFQKAELRDENDNIIQQGTYGKGSALSNSTNDGWVDYVMNNLEALYDIAKDEVVPVSALPASGDMNKTYLLTTNGKTYRWSGTEWIELTNSEAVGRAEAAADLAEQWATKTSGTVDGTEYSAKHYSNLSKDWANKLNATVDGSEYSAKHYANAAQQSADDAQDVADDMADHLSQIDQNTGGVSANSKRIGNIEKLLQGNLYDYDTDDDTAYTKTVPSGAMPYAGLEKVGGKTIVMNQFARITVNGGGTTYGVTIEKSVDDQTVTLSGTATQSGVFRLYVANPFYTFPQGHILFLGCNDSTLAIRLQGDSTTVTGSGIFTTGSNVINDIVLNVANGVDYTGKVLKFRIIDLTLMFGAGNEPTTVAEFEAMFPASYYPYNAGTLLSAGVTEVESVGKNNLCMNAYSYLTQGVQGTVQDGTSEVVLKGTNTSSSSSAWFNISMKKPLSAGTYTIFAINNSFLSTAYLQFSYNRKPTYAYFDSHKISTFTVPDGATGFKIVCGVPPSATIDKTIQIQVEKGSTATAYSPYQEHSYPIPTAIRNLEGYGWSAGTAYNYIDFERKVFVQNVGRVDMGTLTWTYQAYNGYAGGWTAGMRSSVKKPATAYDIANAISPINVTVTDATYNSGNNKEDSIAVNINGDAKIGVPNVTDSATLKSALNGVYLYYELATPVEVDISEYITDDNLIEVEANGTLTFPNSNGDDYRIPIPSEEEYMIDLQSALGE